MSGSRRIVLISYVLPLLSKSNTEDQPSLRAQDSIPFLRRVSTNFGRPSLDKGESDRGLQSRRQSHNESPSSRPRTSIDERPVLEQAGRTSQDSAKLHNLIATTFAKRTSIVMIWEVS
jgi:hypothetical protein